MKNVSTPSMMHPKTSHDIAAAGLSRPTPRGRVRAIALSAAFLTCASLATGCADDLPQPDGMRAHLYGANGAGNPFQDVSWMRLYIRGDGLDAPLGRFARYTPGGGADLDGIPFGDPGERRQLVVEGWADTDGRPSYIVSTGRSPWFTVKPPDTKPKPAPLEAEILFSRVNSLVELPNSPSGSSQRLQAGRMGAATTTTQNELIISGGGTLDAITGAWWRGDAYTRTTPTVEVIDFKTNTVMARQNMLMSRVWHTATGFTDHGQAIIAGGYGATGAPLDDVEVYNPPGISEGVPKLVPKLAVPRAGHTATLIDRERRLILFVGGDAAGTWELWDANNGSHGAQPLPDAKARRHHQATSFQIPGRSELGVLITGGESATEVHQTAMLFDSATGQMSPFNEVMPGGGRTQHAAVFVPEQGIIYLIGGFTAIDRSEVTDRIDAFDTGSVRFRSDAAGLVLKTARGGLSAALLNDNRVLITGGVGRDTQGGALTPLRSMELIYDFVDMETQLREIRIASSHTFNGGGEIPTMNAERVGHSVVALPSGQGVIVGGAGINVLGGGFQPRLEVLSYNPQ